MSKIIIAIGIASLMGLAIPSFAQISSDSCGCPAPVDYNGGSGPHIPEDYDLAASISPDGKWLAYDGRLLLNLQTLQCIVISVDGGLTNEEDVAFTDLVWCPYDPDLLALNVSSEIDTTNMGNYFEVRNIFTYRISTGESHLITPDIYGPYHGDRIVGPWLQGSRMESDSIVVQYDDGADSALGAIYIPQTQTLIPVPFPGIYGAPEILAESPDGKHTVTIVNDTIAARDSQWFYLDGIQIHAPRYIRNLYHASFSPDSKLVALTVIPIAIPSDENFVCEQVWVFSADSAAPVSIRIINFQCLYCTYNYLGANAVFLTDSTLAVSMHKDGSDTSALYEITLDGRIVRQLTYVAQSCVASTNLPENSFSLTSYPNPLTQSTAITISSSEGGAAEVTIVNLLGTEVARLFDGTLEAGEHSFEWDASTAAAGSYFCVVRMNGEARFIPLSHQ